MWKDENYIESIRKKQPEKYSIYINIQEFSNFKYKNITWMRIEA